MLTAPHCFCVVLLLLSLLLLLLLLQVLPSDVDFAVMVTFLDFYCCLLQFVMFKLYHDLGLR
jgi:hypothetical protein